MTWRSWGGIGAAIVIAAGAVGCSETEPAPTGAGGAAGAAGAGGQGGSGGEVEPAADPVAFRATGMMVGARRCHTATVLADGRVLVTGGELDADGAKLDSVELFDAATETWTALAPMPEPRSNHTATLLEDGRVLVAGGGDNSSIGVPSGEEATASALLFDPATGTFSPTGSMSDARAQHRAERLPDGRVLVVGGGTDEVFSPCGPTPDCNVAVSLASAELYDPASGSWSAADSMAESRLTFTLTALGDGGLLAVAGFSSDADDTIASVERFDPETLTWSAAAPLATGTRLHHAAAALGSGGVVVAGGKTANVAPLAKVERFDLAAGTWSEVAELNAPRTGAAMASLQSGRALTAGGFNQFTSQILTDAAIFDEATGSWTPIAPMVVPRIFHTAVVLRDGRVLVCGGSGNLGAIANCELGE
jgi:hypothetical protein